MSRTARDNQRSKVYRAERVIHTYNADNAEYKTLEECMEFAQKVLRDPKVLQAYPIAASIATKLRLRPGQGKRRATAESWICTIKLPRWARQKTVICHELAHLLTPDTEAHGWEFCECYLLLVRREVGPEASETLRKSFKQWKVRYTPPRKKRTFTEEQRQALRERMQGINAAKKPPQPPESP